MLWSIFQMGSKTGSKSTAAIAKEFLKDLFRAGHIYKDKTYLAPDKKKIWSAKEAVMISSINKLHKKKELENILGKKKSSTL